MDIFKTDDNSTPLTEEEKQQLKAKWVTTRAELNELETKGIAEAEIWLLKNKRDILSIDFIKILHKKMFGSIWKWAGMFRTTERNIGVAPYEIQPRLRILLDDIKFWIENGTYSEKEIAIRFHHRLVQIHPFPNGNGRISRLMADLLMKQFGQNNLIWGNGNLTEISVLRKNIFRLCMMLIMVTILLYSTLSMMASNLKALCKIGLKKYLIFRNFIFSFGI